MGHLHDLSNKHRSHSAAMHNRRVSDILANEEIIDDMKRGGTKKGNKRGSGKHSSGGKSGLLSYRDLKTSYGKRGHHYSGRGCSAGCGGGWDDGLTSDLLMNNHHHHALLSSAKQNN